MDTVFKTLKAEIKSVNEETGEVNMLIPVSSGMMDRDGEVIEPSAFKKTIPKFMKHPVLVSSHDYRDLTNQIGEWTKLKITDGGVEGVPKYYINEGNEQADWGFKLAAKGRAAFSIGFIPQKWVDGDGEKSPRRTYNEVELLEISQVIIPSNREAIQAIRSKSVDPVVCELCDEVEGLCDIDIEEKQYSCECIECGHKMKTEKHCQDIKCPECGGEMRRAERPGRSEEDVVTKPEATEDYIRIPVSEGHDDHKIRTITISADEGIKALYCVDCKKNITYLFAKDKGWDMAKAKKWVKEHEGKTPREVSQKEIADEIDYLITLIDENGINDEVKETLHDLAKRIPGSDIPVDIKFTQPIFLDTEETMQNFVNKLSQRLDAKNRQRLGNIADVPSVQTVSDSETDSVTYQEIREAIKRLSKTEEE
jgi:HK97 family phage prohead protease